jgi:hypothetical protein
VLVGTNLEEVRPGVRELRAEVFFRPLQPHPHGWKSKFPVCALLGISTFIHSAAGFASREDDIEDKMADDTREKDQSTSAETAVEIPKRLPKGVVLGKDGKP